MSNSHHEKIPSKLILYRACRFSQLRQNNIKYANFTSNLSYSIEKSSRALQRRILNLPKKDSIKMISYSLSSSQCEYHYFLRSLKRISSSIEHLSLVLAPDNFENPDVELQSRKFLRKILKICSRAKVLDLTLLAYSVQTQFSLKYLTFLKSFKNFSFTLWSPTETHFENLTNRLAKIPQGSCSKRTNSFYFIADLNSSTNPKAFSLDTFENSLERINSTVKNSYLVLDLCLLPQTMTDNLFSFIQKSLNFQILKELYIEINFSEDFLSLLYLLKKSKYIKKFSLKLNSSETLVDTFSISEFSTNPMKFKQLTHLFLNFENFENIQYFQILFLNLTANNPQLSSLTLHLRKVEGFDDSTFASFTESLGNFNNLSNFTFNVDSSSSQMDKKLSASKIKDFYKKISSLKRLQELSLSFSDQHSTGSVDIFGVLCESLQSLTELRRLQLYISSCAFSEESFIRLTNSLILPNLESLILRFNGFYNQAISGNILKQCIESLVSLRNLSELEMNLKCKDIGEKCVEEFVMSFGRMKCLSFLRFYLEITSSEKSIKEDLQQKILKLGKKIDVHTSIRSI